MLTSWDILRYLYLGSVISMACYIIQNSDQFLISYGMNKQEKSSDSNNGEDTPELSFTATMVLYIILSPILWIVILSEKNRRK